VRQPRQSSGRAGPACYKRWMIILAGTVRIAAGQRHGALDMLRYMVEQTRAEPGCVAYSFAFDVVDDHLLRIFEVFQDEAALAAHRASAHMAKWREAWPGLGIGERNLMQYTVSGSQAI
jgi:quinol monooxygenase YgiN